MMLVSWIVKNCDTCIHHDQNGFCLVNGKVKRNITVMARKKIAKNIEECDDIRDIWMHTQWHPYTDFDYYRYSSIVERDFIRPHIIALYKNGLAVTIVIGKLHISNINWKIGYKSIYKSKTHAIEIAYGGLLGEISDLNSTMFIKGLVNCLQNKEADIVFFNHLGEDTFIYQKAKQMPNILCRDLFTSENPHRKLILPDSFEVFCFEKIRIGE